MNTFTARMYFIRSSFSKTLLPHSDMSSYIRHEPWKSCQRKPCKKSCVDFMSWIFINICFKNLLFYFPFYNIQWLWLCFLAIRCYSTKSGVQSKKTFFQPLPPDFVDRVFHSQPNWMVKQLYNWIVTVWLKTIRLSDRLWQITIQLWFSVRLRYNRSAA